MQRKKSEPINQNIKTFSFNMLALIYNFFSFGFFNDLRLNNKLKKQLSLFFKNESHPLQAQFMETFEYPKEMTEPPVRFDKKDGELYYIINFKKRTFFEDDATVKTAYSKSMQYVNEHLMHLGLTDYIIPNDMIAIPDTFSYLMTYTLSTNLTFKEVFLGITYFILKMSLIPIIYYTIKYFV